MRDDLTSRLEAALAAEHEDPSPQLAWVVARARRIRLVRFTAVALSVAGIAGVVSVAVVTLPRDGSSRQATLDQGLSRQESPSPVGGSRRAIVEDIPERQQAEIFAFRAVAATGLMNPFAKRSYNFTYRNDTTETERGWRVGFAANDCHPKNAVFTCRGLSGEDARRGNAITDTFVIVSLEDGAWRVVDVDGNMLADERDRLIGYEREQRNEPSHWEFPAVGVWKRQNDEVLIDMIALWVGPYPTSAPGSACKVESVNDQETVVGEPFVFYQEPPNRAFERAGWIFGRGTEHDADFSRARVRCRQYMGRGWEIGSGPEIIGSPGDVMGVTAELAWHGDKGFTAPALCQTTLVDDAGDVVWEGSARVESLWRPTELDDYPYRAQVDIRRDVTE